MFRQRDHEQEERQRKSSSAHRTGAEEQCERAYPGYNKQENCDRQIECLVRKESLDDKKKKKEGPGQKEGSVADRTGSQGFRDPLSFKVKKINANERDQ